MISGSRLLILLMMVLGWVIPVTVSWADGFGIRPADGRWEFYDLSTNQTFTPRGFNYVIWGEYQTSDLKYPPINLNKHFNTLNITVTLIPGFYDPAAADRALDEMKAMGYNIVRLYFDFATLNDQPTSPGVRLHPGYLANLIDFLEKVQSRSMFVDLATGFLPPTYYDDVESILGTYPHDPDYEWQKVQIMGASDRMVTICAHRMADGYNALMVHKGHLNAMGNYMLDVLNALRAHDPELIHTIFALDILAEYFLNTDERPFLATTGNASFQLGSEPQKSYNMDVNDPNNQREDLANDITRTSLSYLIARIKLSYPELLITTSTFTPYITGRGGYNGVTRLESQWDPRQAFELKLLNEIGGIDFIDLHITPARVGVVPYDMGDDLRSTQWDTIAFRKPLIIGEIGVPTKDCPDSASAF